MLRDLVTHIVLFVCFLILCIVIDANAASGTGRSLYVEKCLIAALVSHLVFWVGSRLLLTYFGLNSIRFPPQLPFESLFVAPTPAMPAMVPAMPAMPAMQAVQAPPAIRPASMLQMPAAMPATPGLPMQPMPQPQQMQLMKPESDFQGLFKLTKQKKPKALAKTNGQVHYCLKGQNGYEWGVHKNGLPCEKPGPKIGQKKGQGKKKAKKKKQFQKMSSSD